MDVGADPILIASLNMLLIFVGRLHRKRLVSSIIYNFEELTVMKLDNLCDIPSVWGKVCRTDSQELGEKKYFELITVGTERSLQILIPDMPPRFSQGLPHNHHPYPLSITEV